MKIKQRSNGDAEMPKWEQDDVHDQLAAQLAEANAVSADDIPSLPRMKFTPKQPAKAEKTINVVELLDALLAAYTAPDVRLWIQDGEIWFEQIVKETHGLFKNQWRLKIASFNTSSIKLIK